jgi:hypothetical protein
MTRSWFSQHIGGVQSKCPIEVVIHGYDSSLTPFSTISQLYSEGQFQW